MKRYTEKTNNLRDKGKYEYTMISDERQYWNYVDKDGVSLHDQIIRSAFEKLGKLEDIEEELGIDLITLFKALKQDTPIWFRTPKYDDKNESVKKSGNAMVGFTTKNEPYITIDTYAFNLKDYGKTWALTKEELE